MRPAGLITCALLLGRASGQMAVNAGTALHVDGGTTLRVETPLTWSIGTGATVVNDGTIVLGPATDLAEAPGAAITGYGTERTERDLSAPLSNADPGGLGAILTTGTAPGLTLVERGHIPLTAFTGETSIARWIRVAPANNTGLGAALSFRYGTQELNGVPETEQRLHVYDGSWNWWYLPSTVNTGSTTVTTTGLDSLGLYTTFAIDLPTGLAACPANDAFALLGMPGEQLYLRVPEGERAGTLDIFAADGKRAASFIPRWTGGTHPLPRLPLSSGLYRLVVDGRTALPMLIP